MTLVPWPHQTRAVQAVIDATTRDVRRIVIASPTGSGKSLMFQMLAKEWLERKGRVILYSNRKMMVDQLSENLSTAGIFHGVRAAGYDDEREHPFQVSSIQTEHSRVTKKQVWKLHDANLVLVDEAHIQGGNQARKILAEHHEAGAVIVGGTATPLGLAGLYDELIVAATMGELRECGALVWAKHFAPDEPDLRAFKKLREGEDPSAKQQRIVMMTPTIFGRVWDNWCQLNPEQKPTLLFGPGVDESLWFAERFHAKGIPCAHIDGMDCWIKGSFYKSDKEARDEVRTMHKAGELKLVCNRYVLREGVDWPWIEHIILAFVSGSLQTYIQTLGRGLRASRDTGKTHLTIQDHGGGWWRHGSINLDREWTLGLTDEVAYGLRAERIREKKQKPPFRCPKCGRVWLWNAGKVCFVAHGGCGFELGNGRVSRPVVTTDGVLRPMNGDVFKPRRLYRGVNGEALWKRMYYRARSEKWAATFRQAFAMFAQENDWGWPDRNWKLMPLDDHDFFARVKDVPMERLR